MGGTGSNCEAEGTRKGRERCWVDQLKKESPCRNSFVLSRVGAGVVGSIRHKFIFGRETRMGLGEELALEVVVFVLWLDIIVRRRED